MMLPPHVPARRDTLHTSSKLFQLFALTSARAGELRQPLCLVLLRNCSSPYEAAVTAAVRLFEAVLSAQARGRAGWLAGRGRCMQDAVICWKAYML